MNVYDFTGKVQLFRYFDIFSMLETEMVHYASDEFLIVIRQSRGYEPAFTLHKMNSFCGYSWWSNTIMMESTIEPIIAYIKRCNEFDKKFKV